MKIVDVCEFYSPTGGGVRAYVDQKLVAAARHGHRLTVVAPGTENRIEQRAQGTIAWVKAPRLPGDRHYRMFWRAADVWRVLDEERPDVVEASSPWRGGWIVAQWPGRAKRVLVMHSDPVASYPQALFAGVLTPATVDRLFGWFWRYLRRLSARFDRTIVSGEWLADRLTRQGLRRPSTVPFGVDRSTFRSGGRDVDLRRRMLAECGASPGAALLIMVGRHSPEKRIELGIDAVLEARRATPIGLWIVGDGYSHERIRRKAARAGGAHVAGRINDRERLAAMVASADALLHCCASETYGFAVAEALCCGTPVIAPNAGGAGALVEAAYGEMFRPGSVEDACRAILRLLTRDRAELSRAATAAADHGIQDIDSHFRNLWSLYDSLA